MKIYTGKIDVKKIDKARLFEGKKGTYLDIVMFVNEEADNYGNHIAIQQQTKQDEEKIYIGNAKQFVKKEQQTQQTEDKEDDSPF
ncbi:hypothetical protein HOB25_04560 [bacterium]|jgi:hypothetical protein|nr:hypothetical protein [bacterium]